MSKTVILGMCLAGVAPTLAQSTLTLPAKRIHTTQVGRGFVVPAKDKLPTRQQCLYSTKDLPASTMVIREIAFQPSVTTGAGMEAVRVTFALDMSIGPKEPRKWSRTFAQNLGKTVTRVFSGSILLPKITKVTRTGWHFRIPLQRPFVVDGKTWARVPGLLIPKDPRLANVKFYFQGAYAYPKANPLGWLFLPSLEQRIGSGEGHRAAALGIEKNNPPSKNGIGVLGNPVPYLRITH